MPRVLITGFCAVPGPNRAGVQLRHVVRALTPLHNVDVLVVRDGDQAYVERQGSVRILRVPTHDPNLRVQVQAFQRALRRQLDGADYDVVHCRDGWSGIPVLEARERLGYAVVFDLARSPPRDERVADPELEADIARDEEACLLAADLVLVPTDHARRHAISRGRPDRIMLAPVGVDVDRFDWDDLPPGGPPRILYTGAMEPGRGVRILVRAMVEVAKRTDAHLVLAGPPSRSEERPAPGSPAAVVPTGFEAQLRAAIADLGLGDRVQILGAVDHEQLPTLIATATVCVAPHAPELAPRPYALYPTKLLEYLACRRAVVAPRRGTVGMVIDHGRDGLLYEPGDPHDLARKIVELLNDRETRERVARTGYERVRRDFTASASRRALRAAYSEIAKRFAVRFAEGALSVDADEERRPEPIEDDFEATVFEEVPSVEAPAADDTGLETTLAPASSHDESRSGDVVAPPPLPDETIERMPVEPPRREPTDSGNWTATSTPSIEIDDEWVVGPVTAATTLEEDGTPLEGLIPPPPPPGPESAFVAGEIDVPTPPPEALIDVGEFTAASSLLPSRPDSNGADTGETGPH